MTDSERISALVMSGDTYGGNPYMTLLTEALERAGIEVRVPKTPVLLPVTRAVLQNRDVDVVQLDWLYEFYIIDDVEYGPIDEMLTVLRAVAFLFDTLFVSMLPVAIVRTVHNKRHHGGKHPRIDRMVNECVFLVADAVTVKCENAIDILKSTYTLAKGARMHVVPDGNYSRVYDDTVSKADARTELSIPEGRFVYLFFGHVREYKGVLELLDAFVETERPDTELWIVGTPHSDELEAKIREFTAGREDIRTTFEYVPDKRVQYYLNGADVLVLPYRDILNSGAAHLGLTYGLPVVAPRIGCLPEILSPENEFLYDRNSTDGLRRELKRAYDHPDLESIERRNYERAAVRNWQKTAAALADVYRAAIDGRDKRHVSSP